MDKTWCFRGNGNRSEFKHVTGQEVKIKHLSCPNRYAVPRDGDFGEDGEASVSAHFGYALWFILLPSQPPSGVARIVSGCQGKWFPYRPISSSSASL